MNRDPRVQSMLAAATIAALLLAALAPAASQGQYSTTIGYIGGPICEGSRTAFKLSCTAYNASYTIQGITTAFYGRDNNVSCPYGSPVPSPAMTNTSCSYAKAVTDITSQCYGMHECSPLFLSDPCVGTYKYMRAVYVCGPPALDEYAVGPVCDNQPFTLSCPAAKVISDAVFGTIYSAFYGRSDPALCNFGGVTNNSCILPSALSEVTSQCKGKQTCSPTFSADPCYGTYKHRSAAYYCDWADAYARDHGVNVSYAGPVCEGEPFNLTCPTGKVIHVYRAFYGSDAYESNSGFYACYPHPLGDINCSLPSALSEVTSQCEGHQTCFPTFSADPCVGTYKTKYASYTCI